MSSDPIQIMIVDGARRPLWRPLLVTWEKLCTMLTQHERRADKDGPGFAPCVADTGTKRGNDAVRCNTLGILDLDGTKTPTRPDGGLSAAEFAGVLTRLHAAGLAFIVYTSHTHQQARDVTTGELLCKARVVIRLDRNVWPAEWPILCAGLIRSLELHGLCDPSISTLSRFYYLPSAVPGLHAYASVHEGQPLNVSLMLQAEQRSSVIASAQAQARSNFERVAAVDRARETNNEPVDMSELRAILRATQGRNRETILKVLRGDPIANAGDRDNTLQRVCSAIRFSVPATAPTAALLEILRPSLAHFTSEIDPITGKREDWEASAADKLDRAQQRRVANDAMKAAVAEDVWKALRAESARTRQIEHTAPVPATASEDTAGSATAPPDEERLIITEKYKPEEIARWASEQGCSTLAEFDRRWIVQRGPACYVWVEGRYLHPVPRDNLFDSIKRDLARAPVEVFHHDPDKGTISPVPLATILQRHSTVARHLEASLTLQRSYYDADTQTLHEACTPLRPLRAREHPQIQHWLDLLDPTGKLTDWCATVTRLDRYSCAIYLDGDGGAGKTLLARGLARLWTIGGPTELNRILGDFNAALTTCPLVFADEAIPKKRDMTATLRALIGSTTRTLNRKYLPECNLTGAIRLIIAGNNDRLMDSPEELSVSDLAAIAARFLYLRSGPEVPAYLNSIGGQATCNTWITEDKIAEHALYLAATRKVNEGRRFIVEGDAAEFHKNLATNAGLSASVCEWITRFLSDPISTPFVLYGSSEVWINVEALAREVTWTKYIPAVAVPSASKLGRALLSLSEGRAAYNVDGTTYTYHRIRADMLSSWIDRIGIGDTNAIRAKLAARNEVIEAWQHYAPHSVTAEQLDEVA